MWRKQKLVNYKTRRWWMIIYMRRDGQYSIVGCRQRRSRPIDPRYKKNMTRCVWQCLSSAHSSGVPILYGTVPVSWNQFYSTIKCMKPKKDGGRMEQTKFPKWNRRKDDKHKICMISQINLKWRRYFLHAARKNKELFLVHAEECGGTIEFNVYPLSRSVSDFGFELFLASG